MRGRPCGCECVGVHQTVRVASTNKDLVDTQGSIIYLRMTIYAFSHITTLLMVSMGKQFYSVTLRPGAH